MIRLLFSVPPFAGTRTFALPLLLLFLLSSLLGSANGWSYYYRSKQSVSQNAKRRSSIITDKVSCNSDDDDKTTSKLLFQSRRRILQRGLVMMTAAARPKVANASSGSNKNTIINPEQLVGEIIEARDTLQLLVDNWQRAVIDCTYADVPRELLEQRNKDALLEKASTFALFDKSVAVVSCKTTNRLVRDYLGATGKGPLVNLEAKLRRALPLVVVVPDSGNDNDDMYVATIEAISQNLSKAQSLSYTAGVADFNSVNNFDEAEIDSVLASSNSNLEQTRQTVRVIIQDLNSVLLLLRY